MALVKEQKSRIIITFPLKLLCRFLNQIFLILHFPRSGLSKLGKGFVSSFEKRVATRETSSGCREQHTKLLSQVLIFFLPRVSKASVRLYVLRVEGELQGWELCIGFMTRVRSVSFGLPFHECRIVRVYRTPPHVSCGAAFVRKEVRRRAKRERERQSALFNPFSLVSECGKEKMEGVNGGVGSAGGEDPAFLSAPSTTSSITTTLTTTTAAPLPLPQGMASPDGEPVQHERPSSLLAPAGKWPPPTPADSHSPPPAHDAAPTTMCGGRHSRWLLCVSANNVTGEQYQPTSPPGPNSPDGSSPTEAHAPPTTTAPRTLPSPSCNLTGCFLKPIVLQAQTATPPNRSPSPHLPPGLPSPLPPGYPSPSGGDAPSGRLGPPGESA